MQIRRFEAPDMQEALKQVKEVMGPDAIILSTKTIKVPGSRPGYQRRSCVEVVAAVDNQPKRTSSQSALKASQDSPSEKSREAHRSRQYTPLFQRLVSSGLMPDFVNSLQEEVTSAGKDLENSITAETFRNYLSWKIMEAIEVTGLAGEGKKIWTFIGPTGVGKTTTLAKLAAHFRLRDRKKIALVTIDTFRIGAVDQLKTYAGILDVPLEVASSPEQLRAIIDQHFDDDVLLIDTIGRSPHDSAHLSELKGFLNAHPLMENHLLLSATTKDADLSKIVERYSVAPIKSYIFTKLDETENYAPLFNQLLRNRKPISYLTTGQNVPEDIEVATKGRIANLVLGGIDLN